MERLCDVLGRANVQVRNVETRGKVRRQVGGRRGRAGECRGRKLVFGCNAARRGVLARATRSKARYARSSSVVGVRGNVVVCGEVSICRCSGLCLCVVGHCRIRARVCSSGVGVGPVFALIASVGIVLIVLVRVLSDRVSI